MFRLEKVFQQDDYFFIKISIFLIEDMKAKVLDESDLITKKL